MGRRDPGNAGSGSESARPPVAPSASARTARAELLVDIFDHAAIGLARIDTDGRFIEVNRQLCEMLGYTREELIGTSTRAVTHPDDFGEGPAFRERAAPGEARVQRGEKRYLRKDGSIRWARRTMSAVLDEHGALQDVISVIEDITEHKRAEEEARNERTLLRTIIDAIPNYIYVKDAQGRFTIANQAWLQARGLDGDTLRGKTVYDIYPAALAAQMDAQDRPVLETGTPLVDNEQKVASGTPGSGTLHARWALSTKVPLRDESNRIVGLVGISRDITVRRRLERERAMEHAIAQALSESRSLEETMPRLLRNMCDVMGWVYGARWAWDPDAQTLRRSECWSDFELELELEPADSQAWVEVAPDQPGRFLRHAWREQEATWVVDIAALENFKRRETCRKYGLRSAFAFPIVSHDEAIGILEFFGREPREPDDALLEVSGAVASQIGQFIRRKQAEEALQESEQQLSAMFENANIGIAVTALDMRYLRVNDRFCDIVGYTREELLRMRISEVNLEENLTLMRESRQRMVHEVAESTTVEKQLVRKDGSLVWVSLATSLVRGSTGAPRFFIGVIQDISESRRAAQALRESEEQFRRLAQYDSLTGLPNRALFNDRLAHATVQAGRNHWTLAVLFIDLDRFKQVNDTFGHATGDRLLKQVSGRLSQCVRGEDSVGRLSGDEFAVVLGQVNAREGAATVARKIVEELSRPFELDVGELRVSASVGITLYPGDATEEGELLRKADAAMYRAKQHGRNNYQFYSAGSQVDLAASAMAKACVPPPTSPE